MWSLSLLIKRGVRFVFFIKNILNVFNVSVFLK
jgi:hypothetical protein